MTKEITLNLDEMMLECLVGTVSTLRRIYLDIAKDRREIGFTKTAAEYQEKADACKRILEACGAE